MYSLDINFLNDRSEPGSSPGSAPSLKPKAAANNTPMIIGALVGLCLPAAAFGANVYLTGVGTTLTSQRDQLQADLQTVAGQASEVNSITEKTATAEADIQALLGVFQKLQPISASLQEVSNQMPEGVLISFFELKDGALPEPDPAAPPPPPPVEGEPLPIPELPPKAVSLKGRALSYAQLNDFLLGLKNSPFLVEDTIKLSAVTLIDGTEAFQFEPFQPEVKLGEDPPPPVLEPEFMPTLEVELPYVVEFQVDANLSSPAPAEVLDKLRNLKADGLVTRIETLQQMGVITE